LQIEMDESSTRSKNDDEANRPEGAVPDSARRDSIAVHEAAHAVAMVVLGLALRSVDIRLRRVPSGGLARGSTEMVVTDTRQLIGCGEAAVLPYMVCLMAGPLAESTIDDDALEEAGGGADDVLKISALAHLALSETAQMKIPTAVDSLDVVRKQKQVEALVYAAGERAGRLVGERWEAIQAVASLLREREELAGHEVVAIVNSFPPSSFPWPDD